MSIRRVRAVAVVAVGCAALAACGTSHSSKPSALEAALGVKQVAGLFNVGLTGVLAPVCKPAAIAGNFDCSAQPILGPCTAGTTAPCASRFAPTKVWFDCYPNAGGSVKWMCQLVDPPQGARVFTTKAQRAAAKHAIWQCKTYNADHVRIGPFLIATSDPHGPKDQRGGAMTQDAAGKLARQLHLKLTVTC